AKGRADGDVAHVFEAPAVRFTEADDDVDLLSAAAVDGRRLAAHRGAHRRRHLVYRKAEPSGSLAVDPNLELGTALVDRGLDLPGAGDRPDRLGKTLGFPGQKIAVVSPQLHLDGRAG